MFFNASLNDPDPPLPPPLPDDPLLLHPSADAASARVARATTAAVALPPNRPMTAYMIHPPLTAFE
jgi:hypothetical protein